MAKVTVTSLVEIRTIQVSVLHQRSCPVKHCLMWWEKQEGVKSSFAAGRGALLFGFEPYQRICTYTRGGRDSSMPKRHAELAISDAFRILNSLVDMAPNWVIADPLRSFSGPRPQGHTCLGRCGQQRPPSQSNPQRRGVPLQWTYETISVMEQFKDVQSIS